MAIYSDEILDHIIAAAADQRSPGPKGLPNDEIEIGTPTNSTGGKTFVRQVRRDTLRERLELAAERYLHSTRIAKRPSQASMADDYEAVSSRLYDALRAMLPEDRAARERLHAAAGMRLRDGNVRRRIVELAELHRAIRAATRDKEAKPKIPRNERYPGDWPLDEFVTSLIDIYQHVLERRPGTSNTGPSADVARRGKASGPLPRFIQAALSPILPEVPTLGALRERVGKVLQKSDARKS